MKRAGAGLAAVVAALVLTACSVSDKPATDDFNPLDPATGSASGSSGPPAVPDLQLRPVTGVHNATTGECSPNPPQTPPPRQAATLCSADLTYVLDLDPAVVDAEEVTSIDAGTLHGGPTVRIFLDVNGATALSNATLRMSTESSPRNWLAVVSQGRVQSAPVVTDQLDGGIVDLTGFADTDAARAAALLLGNGAG